MGSDFLAQGVGVEGACHRFLPLVICMWQVPNANWKSEVS